MPHATSQQAVCNNDSHETHHHQFSVSQDQTTDTEPAGKYTRKLSYRKDDCPLKFSGVPDFAHGYFCRIFKRAFVPIHPLNVHT